MSKSVEYKGPVLKQTYFEIIKQKIMKAVDDAGEEGMKTAIEDYEKKRITNDPEHSALIVPGFGIKNSFDGSYGVKIFTTPFYAKWVNYGNPSNSFTGHHFMEAGAKKVVEVLPEKLVKRIKEIV